MHFGEERPDGPASQLSDDPVQCFGLRATRFLNLAGRLSLWLDGGHCAAGIHHGSAVNAWGSEATVGLSYLSKLEEDVYSKWVFN